MTVNVYVVENHPLLREAVLDYCRGMPELRVCGAASSAEDALADPRLFEAGLVLLDLSLPQMSGLDLLAELRTRVPHALCVVLSGHHDRSYVERALAAGSAGYILKGDPDELPVGIRQVLAGEAYVSPLLGSRT